MRDVSSSARSQESALGTAQESRESSEAARKDAQREKKKRKKKDGRRAEEVERETAEEERRAEKMKRREQRRKTRGEEERGEEGREEKSGPILSSLRNPECNPPLETSEFSFFSSSLSSSSFFSSVSYLHFQHGHRLLNIPHCQDVLLDDAGAVVHQLLCCTDDLANKRKERTEYKTTVGGKNIGSTARSRKWRERIGRHPPQHRSVYIYRSLYVYWSRLRSIQVHVYTGRHAR